MRLSSEGGRDLGARFNAVARAFPKRFAICEGDLRLTYEQLVTRVGRIVEALGRADVDSGVRVAVYGGKSVASIAALLAVAQRGGVFVPLDRALPWSRLEQMLAESGASVVYDAVGDLRARGAEPNLGIVSSDDEFDAQWSPVGQDNGRSAVHGPPDAAYIYFTSGTTGRPKGILGTHRSLAHFIDWQIRNCVLPAEEPVRVAQLASFSFDASLKDVTLALCSGGELVLPYESPYSDPERLLDWLEQQEITVIQTVPSVVEAWSHVNEARERLGRVRFLALAGEPLRGEVVDAWRRAFPTSRARVASFYGATETTIFSTYQWIPNPAPRGVLTAGHPLPSTRLLVVDERGKACSGGVLGQVVIESPYLTAGYVNGSDDDRARFRARNGASDSTVDGEVWRSYWTGDLGRLRDDGMIELHGRADEELKIRGVRVHPSEVESALLSHPSVEKAVVVPVVEDELALAAYIVPRGPGDLNIAELKAHLREVLPASMRPKHLVPLTSIPLTANGKVDREALPAPHTASSGQDGRDELMTKTERRLADLWESVLRREGISKDDDFLDAGGHSLLLVKVAARVRKTFGVSFSVGDAFRNKLLRDWARIIDQRASAADATGVQFVEQVSEHLASSAQQRLLYLNRLDPGDLSYNTAFALELRGLIPNAALEAWFDALVTRHEALRTCFRRSDDALSEVLVPSANRPRMRFVEPGSGAALIGRVEAMTLLEAEAGAAFDLSAGPLFKAVVVRLRSDLALMGLFAHHAVCDGTSWNLLMEESAAILANITRGDSPEAGLGSPAPYSAYARYQRTWLRGQRAELERNYWRDQLQGVGSASALRSEVQGTSPGRRARFHAFRFDAGVAAGTDTLARAVGATQFVVLMAAFDILLAKLTGEHEVLIGTDSAGRVNEEHEATIGMLVNVHALRVELHPDMTGLAVVQAVRECVRGMLEHQELPFDEVVRIVREGGAGDKPLFRIMFRMTPPGATQFAVQGCEVRLLERMAPRAKYELTMLVNPHEGDWTAEVEYDESVYTPGQVAVLVEQYRAVLRELLARPDEQWTRYELTSEALADRVQRVPAPRDYPRVTTSVLERCASTPERTALRQGERSMTYGELGAAVVATAGSLRARFPEGAVIALHGSRCFGTVVALLAVLESGGVVVPIDPAQPLSRRLRLIELSRAEVVVSNEPVSLGGLPCLTVSALAEADHSAEGPKDVAPGNDAAYIFFTSGTSGQPKPILGSHRSVAQFVEWQRDEFAIGSEDAVLQLTSLSFDAVLRDVLVPLTAGGSVVLPVHDLTDPEAVVAELDAQGATILHAVPSVLSALSSAAARRTPEMLSSLRLVFCSGEVLHSSLIQRFRDVWPTCAAEFVNFYGPTETTMIRSFYRVPTTPPPAPGPLPIGKPIDGSEILVVDENGSLCPMGCVGELVICTPYSTHGYLNEPESPGTGFVVNCYGGPVASLYHTGDSGWLGADGLLRLAGRRDHQVKIAGVRVEPAEVEASIRACSSVSEVAVVCASPGDGQLMLIAYVVAQTGSAIDAEALREHCSETLHRAMVPALFLEVGALPRLPNGKVDRAALVAGNTETQEVGREPQSPSERVVASIWSDLLGRQCPCVTQDFFELGGHSLLAATMLTRLRSQLGVTLSLREFLEGRTIEAVAELVDERLAGRGPVEGVPRRSGICLASGSESPAFFCFPPISGTVSGYAELASALSSHQVVAFPASGLEEEEQPCESIQRMGEDYADSILSAVDGGRIVLCGWSFGGLVALETARILASRGTKPNLTVLFDTSPLVGAGRGPMPTQREALVAFARELRAATGRLTDLVLQDEAGLSTEELRTALLGSGLFGDAGEFRRAFRVFSAHLRALHCHVVQPFEGETMVVRALDGARGAGDEALWRALLPNARFIDAPGDHFSLLRAENARSLAGTLLGQVDVGERQVRSPSEVINPAL